MNLPEAMIWEVDSNEAAEIKGTQISSHRQDSGTPRAEKSEDGLEGRSTYVPSEMSLVPAATARRWNRTWQSTPCSLDTGSIN